MIANTAGFERAFTYNAIGNIASIDSGSDGIKNYSYDEIYRLISDGVIDFLYDLPGNLVEENTSQRVYDWRNRLTEDPQWTYSYFENGTLATKTNKLDTATTWSYLWNNEQQLTTAIFKSPPTTTTTQFSYDLFGNRLEKTVNGITTNRWLTLNGSVFAELNADGNPIRLYTHGQNIDEHLSMAWDKNLNGSFESDEVFFYLTDHLGSTIGLTDHTNTLVQKYQYDSYGLITKILDKDGNVITPQSPNYIPNPYTYTGREFEPELGLYYYRSRWFSPEMRRFISEDPIWGTNLYEYVESDPINFNDPLGQSKSYFQCYKEAVLKYYGDDFYTIFRTINSLLATPIPYPRKGVDSARAYGATSLLSYIQHLSNWAKNPNVKRVAKNIAKYFGKKGLRTAGRINAAGFFFFSAYDLKQIRDLANECLKEDGKIIECNSPRSRRLGEPILIPPHQQPR